MIENQNETELFVKNIQLIVDNMDRIIATPKLAGVLTLTAHLSLAYIGGSGKLPLGVIVSLWKNGEFVAECPKCRGKAYLFSFGGSVLSGSNEWRGVCPACKEWMKSWFNSEKDGRTFADRAFAVLREKKRWKCAYDPDDPIAKESGMIVDGKHVVLPLEGNDGDEGIVPGTLVNCHTGRAVNPAGDDADTKGAGGEELCVLEYGLALGDALALLAKPKRD